jgi:hypothetical protein
MANWAVIRQADDICDNVVVWDGVAQWDPPDLHYVVELQESDFAGIGWKYDQESNTWLDVRPQVGPE